MFQQTDSYTRSVMGYGGGSPYPSVVQYSPSVVGLPTNASFSRVPSQPSIVISHPNSGVLPNSGYAHTPVPVSGSRFGTSQGDRNSVTLIRSNGSPPGSLPGSYHVASQPSVVYPSVSTTTYVQQSRPVTVVPMNSPTNPPTTLPSQSTASRKVTVAGAPPSPVAQHRSGHSPSQRRRSTHATAVRQKLSDLTASSQMSSLKHTAAKFYQSIDRHNEGRLKFTDIKKLLPALSAHFGLPHPDSDTVNRLFEKFDTRGKRELTRSEFEDFYRYLLCWMRDKEYPPQMRVRRDFFIQRKQVTLDSVYQKGEKIGQGQFGIVFKVIDRRSKAVRCCKCICKTRTSIPAEIIENEIEILRHLDHPNIVKLHEAFEDYQNIYLIFELLEGDELLKELLERGKLGAAFSEREAAKMLESILNAIAHCHTNRVMHKDLKPENIMLLKSHQDELEVKVIDFGLSEMFRPGSLSTTAAGTPYYMAPEVFYHRFNYKCDVWSAGVLLYLMLTAHLPFDAKSREEYKHVVNTQPVSLPPRLFKSITSDAHSLIKWLLEKDPQHRPTASAALRHPWFQRFKSVSAMDSDGGGDMGGAGPIMPSPLRRVSRRGSKFILFAQKSAFTRICLNLVAMNLEYHDVRRAPEVFRELDTDNDGWLSEEELTIALRSLGVDEDKIPFIVDSLDTDNSGNISYSEFVAALVEVGSEAFGLHLWDAFRQFDLNNDGVVTRDELMQLLRKGGIHLESHSSKPQTPYASRDHKTVEEIIDDIDTNRDGLISFDEFRDFLLEKNR